jgi:hypothetical protein
MGRNFSSGRLLKHIGRAILLAAGLVPQPTLSQDRTFSITGSAGYSLLSLGAVDAKNASDVVGWNALGIPVNDFASLKQSPFFSGRATYRYTRDFALSLHGSYFSKTVSSSYSGPDAVLQLDRSVSATDLMLGVAYYPDLQPYLFQWYLQANVGVILARATARAVGTQATKPGGTVVMVPLVDSEGKYKKAQTSAALFVGADMPLIRHVFIRGEAGYRVAQVGELDGDITRFGVQSNESSTTMFDFSGVLVSMGVGVEF